MPRKARRISESGIYHIMLRGINQQQIFEDDEDCEEFLSLLQECKGINNYRIYAYCLMGNHIHLLLQTLEEPLEQIFRRIGSRFVYWYNTKYQRVGHLFQDRYKSEAVEDDAYFLTVLRYIHQNPWKAGIGATQNYPWSSYQLYASDEETMVDTEKALSMFSSKADLLKFLNAPSKDVCMDLPERRSPRMTDENARAQIARMTKCHSVADFQQLEMKKQRKCLTSLHEKGASLRQLSRLTGLAKTSIERMLL